MAYSNQQKNKVRSLRRQGFSIPAISKKTHVAKSTVSLWVRDVVLPNNLLERLRKNSMDGQTKGRMMRLARLDAAQNERTERAKELAKSLIPKMNKDIAKLVAALLFWCEGSKRGLSNGVIFTNSDPELVSTFIAALEKGFDIDRSKFRLLLHLHDYHKEATQKAFWSRVTGLPLEQFSQSYKKPNTKIRLREGYPGCLSLRYGDAGLAKFLSALYHAFAKLTIGE